MEIISYGNFKVADESSEAFSRIDSECAVCLYKAGKLAVEDVLAYVIKNELTETEQKAVKLYWFEGQKTSRIAAAAGISGDAVRKTLKRAEKKIYTYLKYVVLYNECIGSGKELPERFRFKIVRCIDGKELIA